VYVCHLILGAAKKSSSISKEEKHIVAYHESGHALVSWMMKSSNALLKVSTCIYIVLHVSVHTTSSAELLHSK